MLIRYGNTIVPLDSFFSGGFLFVFNTFSFSSLLSVNLCATLLIAFPDSYISSENNLHEHCLQMLRPHPFVKSSLHQAFDQLDGLS